MVVLCGWLKKFLIDLNTGEKMKSKHSLHFLLLILVFSPMHNGCVPLFLMGAGAAGGYAISKDSVEGTVNKQFHRVFNASLDVVKSKGVVQSQDEEHGKIEGVVGNQVNATIELSQTTERSVKIKVTARKNHLPNIDVAQEVYTDILKKIV